MRFRWLCLIKELLQIEAYSFDCGENFGSRYNEGEVPNECTGYEMIVLPLNGCSLHLD